MSTPGVRSFDVLDTCLTGPWATRTDLWRAAAASVLPAGASDELLAEAVRLRRAGDRRARGAAEPTTIQEVYACLPELEVIGVDAVRMCLSELQLEREGLRPVASASSCISRARAAGHRIAFLSDLSIPGADLRRLLMQHGLAQSTDAVYVSAEVGLPASSGELFDHVLAVEGVPAARLVHRGDDEQADVLIPAARGIGTDPFRDGQLNRYEQRILEHTAVPSSVRGPIAGIARRSRLQEADQSAAAVQAAVLGADVIGPLMCGYVLWLLDDARRRGIARLCFVSRDGQVLHEIAQRVRRPDDPTCHYVYGSRQAWFGATVRSADAEHLSWIFEPKHERATVRTLLAKLGLTPEQVSGQLTAAGLDPEQAVPHDRVETFVDLLPSIADLVVARGRRAREALAGYFRQEGLLDGQPWGLVDVGWYLNAQVALRQALGEDLPVHGYYLALHAQRRPMSEAGDFRAAVREDAPGERRLLAGGWLLESANIVEHVFVKADHGQCVGYERRAAGWEPVLRPLRPLPEWYTPMRTAVLRFTEAVVAHGLTADHGAALFAAGDVAGELFMRSPDREAALLFGATLVSDDLNESGVRPLAPPLGAAQLLWRIMQGLGMVTDDPRRWRHWEAGSLAASPQVVRAAVSAGRAAAPRLRSGFGAAGRQLSRRRRR